MLRAQGIENIIIAVIVCNVMETTGAKATIFWNILRTSYTINDLECFVVQVSHYSKFGRNEGYSEC
jgi:citrate lyase synthetase